jgi:hypothetical protein
MSNVTFALTMTRTIEYTHSFEMNEKHAENAIAKYGSMLEYKRSKLDFKRAFGKGEGEHETHYDTFNDINWKKTTYPDEWTSIEQDDEPNSYEVTIRGVVQKTISVDAIDASEAECRARYIFENYDRDVHHPHISAAAGEMLKIEVVV